MHLLSKTSNSVPVNVKVHNCHGNSTVGDCSDPAYFERVINPFGSKHSKVNQDLPEIEMEVDTWTTNDSETVLERIVFPCFLLVVIIAVLWAIFYAKICADNSQEIRERHLKAVQEVLEFSDVEVQAKNTKKDRLNK